MGRECLSAVLEDAPGPEGIPNPVRPLGGRLAVVGFGLVVLVSVLPWSRFGDSSRFLGAWTPHWSMIAALAGVAGLTFAVVITYRPLDPWLEVAMFASLGLLIAVASFIQHRHPPILSEATFWPWVAALGGLLAVAGAVRKADAIFEARRSSG